MITQDKRLIAIVAAGTLFLLIPLIAMQFTNEVDWTMFDFVVAGVLLYGTGFTSEFVLRKVRNKKYRLGICAGLLVALFIIWAELAIGILRSPFPGQ